jgi:hypothetical protein
MLKKILFATCILLLNSGAVFAADYNIRIDQQPTLGYGIFSNVKTGDRAVIEVTPYRSYCCSIESSDPRVAGSFTRITSTYSLRDIPFTKRGRGRYHTDAPFSEASRVCFLTKLDSFGTIYSVNYYLDIELSSSPASSAKIECAETTLVGKYNTMSSDFNFLELATMGPSSEHMNGTVHLWSTLNPSNGSNNFDFRVYEFGGGRDFSLNDHMEGRDFGRVQIPHDGLPGRIKASVAEYKADSSPAGFTLVGRSELESPNQ